MTYLKGKEEQEALNRINQAALVAEKALCLRAKCGAIIIKDGEVIGEGYNAPPLDDIANRKCVDHFLLQGKPGYDRTCCMHAEWRAILDALKRNPKKITGSELIFTRVDDEGKIRKSNKPLCTVCSRFILDVGIQNIILSHDEGICSYTSDEFNNLSYKYVHPKT